MANIFAEVIGHGGDIMAHKYSSVFGGDSRDNVIAETFKGNFLRTLEVYLRGPAGGAGDDCAKTNNPACEFGAG